MRTTLAAISVGGAIGALARFGLSELLPHRSDEFPWPTLITNISGCLLLGAFMTVLAARTAAPWLRPLVGIGVLGGYTTYSTFAVETVDLLDAGRAGLALTYLVSTVAGTMVALFAGARCTAMLLGERGTA